MSASLACSPLYLPIWMILVMQFPTRLYLSDVCSFCPPGPVRVTIPSDNLDDSLTALPQSQPCMSRIFSRAALRGGARGGRAPLPSVQFLEALRKAFQLPFCFTAVTMPSKTCSLQSATGTLCKFHCADEALVDARPEDLPKCTGCYLNHLAC